MDSTPDMPSLKMSPEFFQVTDGVIIRPCLKRSQKSVFQCLDLTAGGQPEWYEARELISLGASMTPAILGLPKDASACFLSQILERDVPKKYCLSPKACLGILRRAALRGKELPPLLKAALEAQSREPTEYAPSPATP